MSQYQGAVNCMPSVFFTPRLWISLKKTSRPASFMFLVTPNSLAALIELIVSPPALARPRICALLFCACSMKLEKSLAFSGVLTAPSTLPPLACTTLVVSASSAWPNA